MTLIGDDHIGTVRAHMGNLVEQRPNSIAFPKPTFCSMCLGSFPSSTDTRLGKIISPKHGTPFYN